MTEKVNGRPYSGNWFERDLTWLRVVTDTDKSTLFDKADELPAGSGNFFFGVNGWTEKVIRVLETRGTVLGFELDGLVTATDSDAINVLFGHASGAFDGSLEDLSISLATAIDDMLVFEGAVISTPTVITVGKMSVVI